jgi:hypothetical protein
MILEPPRIRPNEAPRRVIALHWHDAALEGFAEYDGPTRVYRFQVLSDPLEEPQFILITRTTLQSLDDLVRALESIGPAQWPVWVPRWQFSTKSDELRAETAILAAFEASPESLILQTVGIDKPPLSIRVLHDAAERDVFVRMAEHKASPAEWFVAMKAS